MNRAGVLILALATGCASAPAPWATRPLEVEAPCDACGEGTDADLGGGQWPDGRVSCERCSADAVLDLATAQEVLAEARAELRDLLELDLGGVRVGLRLTHRQELMKLAGEELEHPALRAFTEVLEVLDAGRVERRRFTIHTLRGLPRASLLGILAHELCHVWQILRGGVRRDANPAFREGAAQYVQWRILELRGVGPWARRLEDNPDPVYGEGLRRFQRLVRDRGERSALELGATRDTFPSGY